MKKDLKKIYSDILKKDNKNEPRKCKARLKNCFKCDYHFKKDEASCPICNTPRRTCGNWAMQGKEVCKMHGGMAGRKMTKGVHVTKGTFSEGEWEEIKLKIKEKNREHEFCYQVATAAFKKIVDDTADPMIVLGAAAEYFSKIARHIGDIDKFESELVHIHTLDEVDKQKLEKKIIKITNRVLQNALLIVDGIIRKEIQDPAVYNKIYQQYPQMFKDLLNG